MLDARRGFRRALGAELGGLVIALTCLVVLSTGVEVGSLGARGLIAMSLAFVSVPALLAVGLWVDRYEPEPAWLLMRTFLWGAAVAIFFASIVNTAVAAGLGEGAAAVISAPIIEELLKGMAVLWIFRRRRTHLNGVLDGVVYALFVGMGFAVVENVQYYSAAITEDGVGGLAVVWVVRGLLTPFLHPFFTMFTAMAIALAARPRVPRPVGALLILCGYVVAVMLHALWNSGIGMALYPVIYAPAFIVTVVILRRSLRAQRERLEAHLAPEVAAGVLRSEDLRDVIEPRHRMRRTGAAIMRDSHGAQELRAYAYLLATELEDDARHDDDDDQPRRAERHARIAELRDRLRGYTLVAPDSSDTTPLQPVR